MSNIDVIGDLLCRKCKKTVHKKTIDMKKIFGGYKSKKSKKVLENPFHHTDPKNYAKSAKKLDLLKRTACY